MDLRTDEEATGEKLLLSEAGLFQTECFKLLLNWLKESIKGKQITVARDTLKVMSLLTRKAETHFCDMPTEETTQWLNRLTKAKGYLEKKAHLHLRSAACCSRRRSWSYATAAGHPRSEAHLEERPSTEAPRK